MFKAIRIAILLLILFFVVVNTWLTKTRSTDWNNSLWVKIYPINADASEATANYIAGLDAGVFADVEEFMQREAARYGSDTDRPVRMELGQLINEQPPALGRDPNVVTIMLWSLRMRWWAGSVTSDQDTIEPDISIFVRYHEGERSTALEDSVGIQKGMFGIVNAYTGRRFAATNNVIIAHEVFHTLGASDKYEMGTGQPFVPDGLADPERSPLYPQTHAEIMAGRIALADDDAVIPKNLRYAVIGPLTAAEIRLAK
ncbi:MAG TPA: hypothetical protein PKK10_08570 [Woeseiaceae bacterium]|nr:hypothetical protein [Woeseiaceae bacterium]